MDFMNFSEVTYSSSYNISLNGPVDDLSPLSSLQAQWVVAVVIYVIVFVVGVPGNALVLWVTRLEAWRSVNAIWFLNLALANLLSCLVVSIHIMTAFMHGHWPLGHMACCILIALFYFNLYASILLLATISADRFLLVFRPIWCQKYRVVRLAWLTSGVAWMLALVLTIPSCIFGRFFKSSFSQRAYCGVVLTIGTEHIDLALTITLFVLSFLGPLVMMIVCYTCVLLRTWRRPATRSTMTLKVIVVIVTSFFFFWMPFQVSRMILVMRAINSHISIVLSPFMLEMALAYVNCCIYPVIYVAAAQGLRFRVFNFWPGQLHQLLTED